MMALTVCSIQLAFLKPTIFSIAPSKIDIEMGKEKDSKRVESCTNMKKVCVCFERQTRKEEDRDQRSISTSFKQVA